MTNEPSRRLKRGLTALAARAAARPPLTAAGLVELRPRRILIVRQHNQMGDMVCATPAFRAIGEAFPQAELGLVTAPVNFEVVRHNPDLDRVFTFDKRLWRRPAALLRFAREVRGWGSELAFVLSSVSFSVTSAALALASGARHVVGPDSRPFGWDVSRHCFSLEMPSNPVVDRPAVEHSLAPLQAVGIDTADRSTVVVPAPEERTLAAGIMAELGLAEGFWAVHPGAGKRQNLWPAERFAAVVRAVATEGRRVLLMHGPADAEALAAVLSGLDGVDVAVAPSCSVGVGAALLERCERFLCNDTGVMHVAGAMGVPTLALFGPTDPRLWKPPSPAVRALRSPRRGDDPRGPEFGWMENLETGLVAREWRSLPGRREEI